MGYVGLYLVLKIKVQSPRYLRKAVLIIIIRVGYIGIMINKTNILVIFILFAIGCTTIDIEKSDVITDEAIPTFIHPTSETEIAKMQQPVSVEPVENINPRMSADTVTPSSSTNANNKGIISNQNTGINDSRDRYHDFFGCSGTGTVQFDQSPMRYSDFISIRPYGHLSGAHVTPIDHMYFNPMDRTLGRDAYEVRAIADGVIYYINHRDKSVDSGKDKEREWRVDIAHTCSFHSYFDLLTDLDSTILEEWEISKGEKNLGWKGISVKSGQLIGRIGGQTLDFGVYDYEITLPGFVIPEHYNYERWKLHTVDPFPFFRGDVRETLLSKNLRKVEPLAGKIDHDVDGTLSGNWFELGTNGLAGLTRDNYWKGHVSIVPNHIDPDAWMVAIGDWPNANTSSGADHFIIVDPITAPVNVTKEESIVKYSLSEYTYCHAGDSSNCTKAISSIVPDKQLFATHTRSGGVGVLLVQLIEDRILKLEIFLNRTADEVHSFTAAAKEYER